MFPSDKKGKEIAEKDIKFIEKAGSFDAQNYESRDWNETTSLYFSRDTDNLPITSTSIEYEPCMDSFYQSAQPGQTFYSPELQKWGCVQEKNTMQTNDPRFKESGFHTTEFDIQKVNGVLELLDRQPSYWKMGPTVE